MANQSKTPPPSTKPTNDPPAGAVTTTPSKELKAFKEETIHYINQQVTDLAGRGELVLPKDYIVSNALQGAWLILLETQDKDNHPVLEVCTKESICNSLFKMVVWGLNAMKKQCSFIAYGTSLKCDPEYTGAILMAKRFAGLKDIKAQVVYEGEEFITMVDPKTGREQLVKHGRSNSTTEAETEPKIRYCYAIMTLEDGTTDMEVMRFGQIEKAWNMRKGEGLTRAHKEFPDQQCKKTVYSRACKLLIRTSSDVKMIERLEDDDELIQLDANKATADEKKRIGIAGQKVIDITDIDDETDDKDPKAVNKGSENGGVTAPKVEGKTEPKAEEKSETAAPTDKASRAKQDKGNEGLLFGQRTF